MDIKEQALERLKKAKKDYTYLELSIALELHQTSLCRWVTGGGISKGYAILVNKKLDELENSRGQVTINNI